jgi:hypothetical protein
MVARRPAHVAIAPPLCPKGVVVGLKRETVEGKGGGRWPAGHQSFAWPALHLAPIMLTPLTKSIKSKSNLFHPFPKFFSFIYLLKFLDFILCNDEINMLWKRSK